MSTVLGIDEAGRGPVIGPLVMCGVVCEEEEFETLRRIGVKDSKQLTPGRRESLVPLIKDICSRFSVIKVSPKVIERENLNDLELRISADLINELKSERIILDAPVRSEGISTYCEGIRELLDNKDVDIHAEHKADVNYPVVSAASILAKVARDSEISHLHEKHGNFGSGYPSDPKTKAFIKDWNKFGEIVRRNWLTCKEMLVNPGRVMVMGGVDTGKTEFCKLLVNIGLKKGYRVGVLDIDIGQSHIGQAGSLGFGVPGKTIRDLSHIPATITCPIGRLSPAGVTERIVVGIKQMLSKISNDVDFLVVDTCGYVHTEEAVKLKFDLIESINPTSLVFLEREKELDPFAGVIPGERIWRFPVDSRAKGKSLSQRERVRKESLIQPHRDSMIEH